MARPRTVYRCSTCGAVEPKWTGRCPGCEAWSSLVEEVERPVSAGRDECLVEGAGRPMPIAEVDVQEWQPAPTHVGELDRVMQGGLVPGSATLLGGEPGIGKSTLLLQALAGMAKDGRCCLYVTAEESAQQVRLRAQRLATLPPNLWLVSDTSLPHVMAHVRTVQPDVLAVDSIQTVHEPELSSAPGSVAQRMANDRVLVLGPATLFAAWLALGRPLGDGGFFPIAWERFEDGFVRFYEVRLPFKKRTDRLSTALVALDPKSIAVEWKEKRPKQG